MATSVILSPCYYGHFFWPPGKNLHTFSCKKPLFLILPNFFGPLATILTEFHCIVIRLTLMSMEHLVWIKNTCYDSLRERWSTMLRILSQFMKEGKLHYVRYLFTLYSSTQVFCCFEPCWYKQTLLLNRHQYVYYSICWSTTIIGFAVQSLRRACCENIFSVSHHHYLLASVQLADTLYLPLTHPCARFAIC